MILKLIRPKVKKNVYLIDQYTWFPNNKVKYVAPPLALAILASLTPKDVQVSIIDEDIEKIDFDAPADLVGITITPFTAERGYEIADIFRKQDVKVILGGIQVTFMPEIPLKHADSVVIGEAENIWPKVIFDFKNNRLKRVYYSKEPPSLVNRPLPRWDLIKKEKYSLAPIISTRGCPYRCEYCVVGKHFGHKIRKRPINEVIKEIKYLKKNYKQFWFVDYDLFFDKEYAKKLLRALIPLNIRYACFTNVEVSKDEELLDLILKSGCHSVSIGFETLNPENLKDVNKTSTNNVEDYPQAIKKIQGYGINVRPQFMVGMEHDNKTVFKQVENFINRNDIIFPDIYVAAAHEGTQLYKRLVKEKKIDPVSCKKPIRSKWVSNKISPQDLILGQMNLFKSIYSYDSIFNRIKKFYENNKSVIIKKKLQNRNIFNLTLSDKLKKLHLAYLYVIKGDFNRMKFVLKLLWHPKSIYKGIFSKDIPRLVSFVEWRSSLSAGYFVNSFKTYKERSLTNKVKFIINLFRHDYEQKIKEQGVNLPFLISMQEWRCALNPRFFFNACANSRIKNKFLFIFNLLILKLELQKDIKRYCKIQNKYYERITNQQ